MDNLEIIYLSILIGCAFYLLKRSIIHTGKVLIDYYFEAKNREE